MAWADVEGQEFPKRLFQAHLARGQVANAYLLAGPDGIGKRKLALEMAKAMNCTSASDRPCDACQTCLQIARGAHPDVHRIGPSGASAQVKIDDIRALLGRLILRPFSAATQVALITDAERMTEEAANSLLKMLEEPPRNTHFLLTTSQLPHCLPTIISRCQLVRCRRLADEAVARILVATGIQDSAVAQASARMAGGSVSRASALAQRWQAREAITRQLAEGTLETWLSNPPPQARDELTEWLDILIGRVRDAVLESAEPQRYIEAGLELVQLRDSMEQFISPRLVGTLARETWLSLASPRG